MARHGGTGAVLAAFLAAAALSGASLAQQIQSQPLPPATGGTVPPATGGTTPPASAPPASSAPAPKAATPSPQAAPAKPAAKTDKASQPVPDGVNINTASVEDLRKLPTITQQRAQAIVRQRPYAKIEELVTKKVLKQATFDRIKPHIVAK